MNEEEYHSEDAERLEVEPGCVPDLECPQDMTNNDKRDGEGT